MARFGIALAVPVTPGWTANRTAGSNRSGPVSRNRRAQSPRKLSSWPVTSSSAAQRQIDLVPSV